MEVEHIPLIVHEGLPLDDNDGAHHGDLEAIPLPLPSDMRAISYEQLSAFEQMVSKHYEGSDYSSKTMRDINRDFIAPYCKKTRQNYARFLNPDGLKSQAFVTHCWDEPFADFVNSIKSVFHSWIDKPNLWICSFALTQDEEVLEKEIALPIPESHFVQAIEHADWFVVVRNANTDLYSRIWCVCELWYAKEYGLTEGNKTKITGADNFHHLRTSCLDATSSKAADKDSILKALLGRRLRAETPFSRHHLTEAEEKTVKEVDVLIDKYRRMEAGPTLEVSKKKTKFPRLWVILIMLLPVATLLRWLQASPQDKARSWLEKYPGFDGIDSAHQQQLSALATLYFSGRSPEWEISMPNWLNSSIDACDWLPLSVGRCDGNGFYKWIHIPTVYEGTIPSEIGMLTSLTSLTLWECKGLIGSIPSELGSLSLLEGLQIARSGLLTGTIPSELARISNLAFLSLEKNSLSGSIPFELQNLVRLKSLYLDGNKLTGPLPSHFGNLSSLESLNLGGDWIGTKNRLSGPIPTEFGRLSKLRSLQIESNRLTGTIPSQLGLLAELSEMSLYHNLLSGTVPSELLVLPRLPFLKLYENLSINCTTHPKIGC